MNQTLSAKIGRDVATPKNTSKMYLGEVIHWIATKAGSAPDELQTNFDKAERELIEKCAAGKLTAKGILEGSHSIEDSIIDENVWRAGTVKGRRQLILSPLDPTLGSEFGGVVSLSHEDSEVVWKRWSAVHVSYNEVMEQWPEPFSFGVSEVLAALDELPEFLDEKLIKEVEAGRMFLPEAEEIARAHGLGPLHVPPVAADFAILTKRTWTIEMVVAWIIWRAPDEVVKFHEEYHRRWTTPRSPFDSTPDLSLDGVREYFESSTDGIRHAESFESAMSLLLDALSDGDIKARAISSATLEDKDVEPGKWRYLKLANSGTAPTQFEDPAGVHFGMITFSSRDVTANWPLAQTVPPLNSIVSQGVAKEPLDKQRRQTSRQQIRDAIVAASVYFGSHKLLMWTRDEAENELPKFFEANSLSRVLCRQIFAESEIALLLPEKRGRRGPVNSQRQMELDEFRRSFVAANMRN